MKIQKLAIFTLIVLFLGCSGGDLVPAYKTKDAGGQAPVKLPPISEKILDNGLKVMVVEHHELPIVSMRIQFKAGQTLDPIGKAGLADMTASLLTKGTKTRSATEIAEAIDFVGGRLNSGSGWDASNVSCQVLKKHLETGLDLFSDVILNPAFQKNEIERLRKRSISSYIDSKDDPANLADMKFMSLLYKDHPYGYTQGTDKTLPNITTEDITGFYDSWYAPNNAILMIAGDITPDEGFKLAESKFAGWAKKELPVFSFPEPIAPKGIKIVLVNKKDAVQSQICLGHLGVARTNSDFFSINLMNYLFGGGGFSSRLMKIIRSEKGLTYGINSGFDFRLNPGPFTITTFTKNASVGEAIKETLNQTKLIKQGPIRPEELTDAQSYYSGSYPMRFETPDQIAGQLMSIELYGLGADYVTKYRDRIKAVTTADVQAAAQKYLDAENLIIVVVGKADEVKEQLQEFGEVEVVEIEQI